MDKKYGEFVGVDNVHAAIVLEDTLQNYLAEIPEYFAPAAEIAGEPEINNNPTYYDNKPGFNYVTEGITTLTITFSGVPAPLAAKYLGKKYDATTGRVYDDGQPNPPETALSFRFNKGPDGFRYYQYLKGTFSGGTEEAGTKTNNVDIRTYQMTYTAIVTAKEWELINSITGTTESKGLKRIFGDTTDENFNPAGWFSAVQTPDTATPPAKLELVSSVPADNATGVAVDSVVELTFNNKILSQVATLFDDAFEVVPTTIVKDATGKILTVTPKEDLKAETPYTLMITNITDVFGQKIENKVIKFTTA